MDTRSFEIPAATWRRDGGRRAFRFRHSLEREPLLTIDALGSLVDRLGGERLEVHAASAEAYVAARVTHRADAVDHGYARPGDLVRNAEADGRWMAIHHVETDPAYRELVEDLFTTFLTSAGLTRRDAYRPEGYVFVGATGSVAPAHVDHEHNLFFQVLGSKRFTTGTFPDEEREHRTFEGMYAHHYGNTDFPPASPEPHELGPGDGLYVAPPTLHVVENTGALTVSFSLVFHDASLDRAAKVYAFNAHLRSAGRSPRPPGRSAAVDTAKAATVDTWRVVRRTLTGSRRR